MICEEKADNSAWMWENEFAKAIVGLCIAELEAAKESDPFTGKDISGLVNDVLDCEIDNLKWMWGIK